MKVTLHFPDGSMLTASRERVSLGGNPPVEFFGPKTRRGLLATQVKKTNLAQDSTVSTQISPFIDKHWPKFARRLGKLSLKDIKVMTGNDFALVKFANLFQPLLLAAGLAALLSPCLVATRVGAVI